MPPSCQYPYGSACVYLPIRGFSELIAKSALVISAAFLACASPQRILDCPIRTASGSQARVTPSRSISAVKRLFWRHPTASRCPWKMRGDWRVFIWLKYNDFNVITHPTHLRRSEPPFSALLAFFSSSVQADCGCAGKTYRSRFPLLPQVSWQIQPGSQFGCTLKQLLFLSFKGHTEVWQWIRVFGVEALFTISRLLASKMAASSTIFELFAYGPVDIYILVVLAELFLGSPYRGHELSMSPRAGVMFGIVVLKFIEFGCAQSRTTVLLAPTASNLRRIGPCTPSPPPASAPCPPVQSHPYESWPPGVAMHLGPYYLFGGVGSQGFVAAHAVV